MKKTQKLELIYDYIYLEKAYEFCENLTSDCDFLRERTQKLIRIYKKIFFKIGLINLSFAILEKENKLLKIQNFNYLKLKEKVEKLENNIELIIKSSKLNEFEKNYVVE